MPRRPSSGIHATGESLADYPGSLYAAGCDTALGLSPLAEDAIVDHAIIGGGFAGLGAALRLAAGGHSVALVEAGRIGWGASGRNGGQVHVGWNKDQTWFEHHYGADFARQMWQVALDARAHLDRLLALCQQACEFRPGLLHINHRARLDPEARAHVEHMDRTYGYALRYVPAEVMRDLVAAQGYFGGYCDPRGGHLHPLRLVMGMARAALAMGARIYDTSPALAIRPDGAGWCITTPGGSLRAGRVLCATGGYARGLLPGVDARVLPMQNYIAATRPLPADLAQSLIADGMAVSDSRFVVYYYRMSADNRLIFGGGESYSNRFPRDVGRFVRRHLEKVFPQLAGIPLDYAWGGTLSVTPNRLPHGREMAPGLFSLSGFSGLGVVLAPYLGAAAADAMLGRPGPAWDGLQRLPAPRFPGGTLLRGPTLAAAMSFFALRDRL